MPDCYIFAGGRQCQGHVHLNITSGDLVIAADSGYTCAKTIGVTPDILIGDLDSIAQIPDGLEVVRLPAEKDVTDTLAAIDYGLSKGFKTFHIYGGLGGRLDHTFANIACLQYLANRGACGYLYGDRYTVTAFTGRLELTERKRGTVSVFAYGGAAYGVTITGLKYPLTNADITTDFPVGISNEFIGSAATIEAQSGVILVVYPTV